MITLMTGQQEAWQNQRPISTLSEEEKMMTSTKKSTYSYEKKQADIRDIFDIETKAADRMLQ